LKGIKVVFVHKIGMSDSKFESRIEQGRYF